MTYPEFCPDSACINHIEPSHNRWFKKFGFYRTNLCGRIRRFRCLSCGKTFSTRTFSIDYFSKKAIGYRDLLLRHNEGMSIRGISRSIGSSCGSVQNRIDRLTRQAIAIHEPLRKKAALTEDICIDGFVSLDVSRYFPSENTISISGGSRFFLDISHATRRRSGTMSEHQKERAAVLYSRVDIERDSVARTFQDLLSTIETERPPQNRRPLIIVTDDKKAYQRAICRSRLWKNQTEERLLVHFHQNSKLPRTSSNPLLASNYIDGEIRKDQANHRRETNCFNRNVANGMSRLCLYLISHNYFKKFDVKAPLSDTRSHAEAAGVSREEAKKATASMFKKRFFLSRISLIPNFGKIWKKDFDTPLQGKRGRLPAYAFA
jgi:transposase-like protein